MNRKNLDKLDEQLSAYLDGELTDDQQARIDALLHDDPSVRDRLHRLRETAQWVAELPRRAAPAELPDDVIAAIERNDLLGDKSPAPIHRRPAWRTARSLLLTAALLAVTVGVGWWAMSPTRDTPELGSVALGPAQEQPPQSRISEPAPARNRAQQAETKSTTARETTSEKPPPATFQPASPDISPSSAPPATAVRRDAVATSTFAQRNTPPLGRPNAPAPTTAPARSAPAAVAAAKAPPQEPTALAKGRIAATPAFHTDSARNGEPRIRQPGFAAQSADFDSSDTDTGIDTSSAQTPARSMHTIDHATRPPSPAPATIAPAPKKTENPPQNRPHGASAPPPDHPASIRLEITCADSRDLKWCAARLDTFLADRNRTARTLAENVIEEFIGPIEKNDAAARNTVERRTRLTPSRLRHLLGVFDAGPAARRGIALSIGDVVRARGWSQAHQLLSMVSVTESFARPAPPHPDGVAVGDASQLRLSTIGGRRPADRTMTPTNAPTPPERDPRQPPAARQPFTVESARRMGQPRFEQSSPPRLPNPPAPRLDVIIRLSAPAPPAPPPRPAGPPGRLVPDLTKNPQDP